MTMISVLPYELGFDLLTFRQTQSKRMSAVHYNEWQEFPKPQISRPSVRSQIVCRLLQMFKYSFLETLNQM